MAGEDAWAWVPVMFERYRAWEQATVKQTSAAVRSTFEAALATREVASSWACSLPDKAKAHAADAAARCRSSVQRATCDYPEGVIIGTSLGMGCALGAANGSMLGRAPRRLALAGMCVAYYLREPLSAKWGNDVAATSSSLSDALKAKAEAAGLLPSPPLPPAPPAPLTDA